MKTLLIKVQDDWKCDRTLGCIYSSDEDGYCPKDCEFEKAKEAVEVTQSDTFLLVTKGNEDGNPVTLYAVKENEPIIDTTKTTGYHEAKFKAE